MSFPSIPTPIFPVSTDGFTRINTVQSFHEQAWQTYLLQPEHAARLIAEAQILIVGEADEGIRTNLYAENLALQAVAVSLAQERSVAAKTELLGNHESDPQALSDEASATVSSTAPSLLRARVEYAQATVLMSRFDYDRAETVLRSILRLLPAEEEMDALPTPELRLLVDTLSDIGQIQHRRGEFPEALETQLRAHRLVTRASVAQRYKYGEAIALNRLGNVYDRLGDYTAAINAHQQCLSLRETLGDSYGKAVTLNNLANTFLQTKEAKTALDYYNQVLLLCREIGFEGLESGVLGNMAIAFHSLGDLTSAIDHNRAALRIQSKMTDLRSEAITLSNLGDVLREKGDFAEAQDCLENALQINRQLGDRHGMTMCLTTLGRVHAHLQEDRSFRPFLEEALELAEFTGSQELITGVHWAFVEAYKQRGDFERALHHFELYDAGKEAQFKAQTMERIRTLQLKQEMEQSRKEVETHRLHSMELAEALREAQTQRALAERLANEDALTGLRTRRQGDQFFAATLESAIVTGRPLSIILADADHFKSINDRYSHLTGDEVLRHLATICQQHCRTTDISVRFGGEEILFILPDTDQDAAVEWAEILRIAVEKYEWDKIHHALAVTLSMGVCTRFPTSPLVRPEAMIRIADSLLYEAKNSGRNRVRF